MNGTIRFEMRVPITLREDDGWHIASCDMLDVVSQGKTRSQALDNVTEALQLFIETCHEIGTLDTVLRECGFHAEKPGAENEAEDEPYVSIPLSLVAHRHAENRAN